MKNDKQQYPFLFITEMCLIIFRFNMKQKNKTLCIYYKKASGDIKVQYQITSFKWRLYLVRTYIYFYPVVHRNEIKLPSFPETHFLQSKLKSNQRQGREKNDSSPIG